MSTQLQSRLPPNYRMERLVLPKPALDRIRDDITRDVHARLGDNEAHIYDVRDKGQVVVWNFSDGRIMSPTGPLSSQLEMISSISTRRPIGSVFVRIDVQAMGVGRMWLPKNGAVPNATVELNGNRVPLIGMLRTFFDEPTWTPHGVMGSGTAIITDQELGRIDFGKKLCKVSSEHVCHPETVFPNFPKRLPQNSRILSVSVNYHFKAIPSNEMLRSIITVQKDMKMPVVILLADTENGNKQVDLKAWVVSPELDVNEVAKVWTGICEEVLRRFGRSSGVVKPPEQIMFEIARWMEIFENRYNNRTVFEVPIQDETGQLIYSL